MASEDKKSWFDRIPSWTVLVFSLVVALCFWLWWMQWGIGVLQTKVSRFAPPYAASGSASAASSVSVPDHAATMAEIGQSGDAFGGANALFAAIAGALVFWAGVLQSRALKEARQAYNHERDARKREQFESLFFRMLELTRELTERIETRPQQPRSVKTPEGIYNSYEPPKAKKSGAAALDAFANSIHKAMKARQPQSNVSIKELVAYYRTVYDRRPSALGPYFRLLYQTFKLVANSGLPGDIQVQYANIARGQVSDGAVLLLALNGLTMNGHKFIRYIEEFGLLEHMLPEHWRDYGQMLSEGYRPRAFKGSEARESLPHEIEPVRISNYFYQGVRDLIMWEPDQAIFEEIGTDIDK